MDRERSRLLVILLNGALALAVVISLSVFLGEPVKASDAMTFDAVPPGPNELPWIYGSAWAIYAEGDIDKAAPQKLDKLIEDQHIPAGSTVYFNSPGGNLIAAFELGRVIRRNGFSTVAGPKERGSESICMSACSLAFLGGKFRYLDSKAAFGVHRFFATAPTADDMGTAQVLSSRIVDYIREMGVDPDLFAEMTRAGRDEMNILPRSTLESLSVINNAFEPTIWSIEASAETGIYLKGARDTAFGINKLIFLCGKEKVLLYAIFDPQRAPEEVTRMPAQSLLIDDEAIPMERRIDMPAVAKNGWINVSYELDRELIVRLLRADRVGVAFQNVHGHPLFLGFNGMELGQGRDKLRGLLSSCGQLPNRH